MAEYSFYVLDGDSYTLSSGMSLADTPERDAEDLVGQTLEITALDFIVVNVSDAGQETNFGDNDSGQRLAEPLTLEGETYDSGSRIEAEYLIIVEDDAGNEYTLIAVNITESNPNTGTSEAIAFVGDVPPAGTPLEIIRIEDGPNNGGPSSVDEIEIVPICFCDGTGIMTCDGQKTVESLHEGQRVLRHDGSETVLRKVLQTRVSSKALAANPKLRPVRITAGALGNGLPRRDLLVSRQHRMLVSSPIVRRMFGTDEVLIAAIRLTALPGVFVDSSVDEVRYFHLLFDRHEVIVAEGAPSESLFTGPEALKAIGPEARLELTTLFPELCCSSHIPRPARLIPTGALQRKLVARHAKNEKAILTPIK